MNARCWILALACSLFAVAVPSWPAEPYFVPPLPRVVGEDECKTFSAAEFEQLLQKLKADRNGLNNEWKSLQKRKETPVEDSDQKIQMQLKQVLQRLREGRLLSAPAPANEPERGHPKTDAVPPKSKEQDPATSSSKGPATAPGDEPIDSLAQAQALFRSRRYEEALASFQLVDLKGRKADARAPIQYLMAVCMLHLGKNDEAIPLLRDVANSRGDEKVASYAQWQLDMYRWERDIQDRLQMIRQRRQAVEKRQ